MPDQVIETSSGISATIKGTNLIVYFREIIKEEDFSHWQKIENDIRCIFRLLEGRAEITSLELHLSHSYHIAMALSNGIGKNTTLRHLAIHGSSIDFTVMSLALAMRTNGTLTSLKLNIYYSLLSMGSKKQLEMMMKENETLTTLEFDIHSGPTENLLPFLAKNQALRKEWLEVFHLTNVFALRGHLKEIRVLVDLIYSYLAADDSAINILSPKNELPPNFFKKNKGFFQQIYNDMYVRKDSIFKRKKDFDKLAYREIEEYANANPDSRTAKAIAQLKTPSYRNATDFDSPSLLMSEEKVEEMSRAPAGFMEDKDEAHALSEEEQCKKCMCHMVGYLGESIVKGNPPSPFNTMQIRGLYKERLMMLAAYYILSEVQGLTFGSRGKSRSSFWSKPLELQDWVDSSCWSRCDMTKEQAKKDVAKYYRMMKNPNSKCFDMINEFKTNISLFVSSEFTI